MPSIEFRNRAGVRTISQIETLTEAGSTDWIALSGQLAVQITGAASNLTYVVERSVTDPESDLGAHPAPADDAPLKGDPTLGMSPQGYFEPGTAWWRVTVNSFDGGPILVAISGTKSGDPVR